MIEKPLDVRADNKRVEWLRAKFLNQALKYLGVPYAKKYHEEGSKYFKSIRMNIQIANSSCLFTIFLNV